MSENIYFAEDNKDKIDYFSSLLLKQYQMYNACEYKVNILATISAIFIGATIIFIDKNSTILYLNIGIIFVLFSFIVSLAIMIWNVGPDKLINPNWVGIEDNKFLPNHRSIYGINDYKEMKDYKEYISTKLSLKDICEQIINQIFVMNKMIWKIQGIIKTAVTFNIIGLILFILIIFLKFIYLENITNI